MPLNSTQELIDEIHAGRMVILMDDEDRENEGDLVMAASAVGADDINFMARYGRGLICLTLTPRRCAQLRLPLMVNGNQAQHSTAFTLSIEAAEGVTTGISAADRAVTVQAAVAPEAGPLDIVQPGHIFPLMAQPGGVLTRAGHTEAGCDLARLAGLEPAAVIVEILNEDGTMARRPDLEIFAREHGIKMGTIANLIHYRAMHEKTVERVNECRLDTEFGAFTLYAYKDSIDEMTHFALVKGEIHGDTPVLVRVHLQDDLCDLTFCNREGCGWPLGDAIRTVSEAGNGVVVVLRNASGANQILKHIEQFKAKDAGQLPARKEHNDDLRTYGLGAQILTDVGVRKMRVLSAPKKMHAISGFGLEVVEYVST